MGGQELAERLAAECPARHVGPAAVARGRAVVRRRAQRCAWRSTTCGCSTRAIRDEAAAARRGAHGAGRALGGARAGRRTARLTRAALDAVRAADAASSALLEDYLRRHAPDVVVLTSLTYSRSQQLDLLKAARALRHSGRGRDHELGSPVEQGAAAHRARHGDRLERGAEAARRSRCTACRPIASSLTGAQCYDQWFTRTPGAEPRGVLPRDGPARRPAVRALGALGAEPDAGAAGAGARDALDRGAARAAPIRACASSGVLVRPHPGAAQGVGRHQPRRASTTSRSTAATRSIGDAKRRLLRLALLQRRGRRPGDERVPRSGDRRPAGADLHAARVPDAPGGDDRISGT